MVRITHWLNTLSFLALLVSGIAILLAHPRLYWGETGGVGTPSFLDLPLPFVLAGQSGWGRYLHFLSAWICMLTGAVYFAYGIVSGHFRRNLAPSAGDPLRWKHGNEDELLTYNVLQKLTYLVVIFALFPLIIWTGLAMSPAIVSVFPWLVEAFGGQQSARAIHFFLTDLLVLFLIVHLLMVSISGFVRRMRGMITGRAARQEHA